ncbi:MAG: S46 family peptidase [Candidatus Krumholzibacteriia bacterium]
MRMQRFSTALRDFTVFFPALAVLAILATIAARPTGARAEEGMYPMSDLGRLDLQAEGLAIPTEAIYNPDGLSLVDGICKVGGCTGAFVSDRGLILTNHHCAYRAVQTASTPEHDYLAEGFSAATDADELPAAGYTVRITEWYEDVSAEVLSAIVEGMGPQERSKAVETRSNEIVLRTEAAHPGLRAEVSEMFTGKTYVLFVYTYLRDVRLVYAPPKAVGNFGGEPDNWMWPRHSGDFSFLRAYVAPDGSPAAFAAENVPYRPRKHLTVQANGVRPDDFVFLFGYPGRTYRHRTSHFLAHEAEVRMPAVVNYYGWQIRALEALGEGDRAAELKLSSRVRSLANVWKNYRGKLLGVDRLQLVARKQAEEADLQRFIEADPQRAERYGDLLAGIDAFYAERAQDVVFDLWLSWLRSHVATVRLAFAAYDAAQERLLPEAEREQAYQDRNLDQTRRDLEIARANAVAAADRIVLLELLRRGGSLPAAREIEVFDGLLGDENAAAAVVWVDELLADTRVHEPGVLEAALEQGPQEIAARDDPAFRLAVAIRPLVEQRREAAETRQGRLDELYARLYDVKQEFEGEHFVPDANGTLRLTWGRVEGYTPRDAIWYQPFTTLAGLLEKATGEEPFRVPEPMRDLIVAGEHGGLADEALGDVPVNVLYSTDTTGGSSGSPVLDAHGRLVAVNFDRAWEATINDFAWDRSYSRSIGVDIRYVLWVAGVYGGQTRLLEEMGATP